jgi:hypothetical protein
MVWTWIILPVVLTVFIILIFTALIFETTAVRTSERNIQPHSFGASPLALLFHGSDHEALAGAEKRRALDEKKYLENFPRV